MESDIHVLSSPSELAMPRISMISSRYRSSCSRSSPVSMGADRDHIVDANGVDGPQDRAEADYGDGPNGAGGLPTAKGPHRQIPAIWHQRAVG
jgi:hypothetical protein